MKVFISWSGERSKLVAEALRYWLPKVIQAIEPWMSANDIEKGARWRTELGDRLGQSSFGIICLTPENLESPWLHFEAGALSKQQPGARVCTYLFDLEPDAVAEPLAQFQTTRFHFEDTRSLIHTLNRSQQVKLAESEIDEAFDVWWPRLYERLSTIPDPGERPSWKADREVLEEILELVRLLARGSSTSVSDVLQHWADLLPAWVPGSNLTDEAARVVAFSLRVTNDEVQQMSFPKQTLLNIFDPLGLTRKNPQTSKMESMPEGFLRALKSEEDTR